MTIESKNFYFMVMVISRVEIDYILIGCMHATCRCVCPIGLSIVPHAPLRHRPLGVYRAEIESSCRMAVLFRSLFEHLAVVAALCPTPGHCWLRC